MNKINGFDPENQDYACAVFCATIEGCMGYCSTFCIYPYSYFGTFQQGASISGPSTYWLNYVWMG